MPSVKSSVKPKVNALSSDYVPKRQARNAEEAPRLRQAGRPRDTSAQRRLTVSVADALAIARALETSSDASAPRLADMMRAVADAKRAQPHRTDSIGRPALVYRVEFPDGTVADFVGMAATAQAIGKSKGALAVRLSKGNGVARYGATDTHGNPANLSVFRQDLKVATPGDRGSED